MGISASCDGCGRDADDEVYCRRCAKSEASAGDETAEMVGDLAAAIRRGDMVEAEYLLDKIATDFEGWSDRVSIGRYSSLARAA